MSMEICTIGARRIVVRGIGAAFFRDGLPLGIAAQIAERKGLEVSWLHVADDLQKQGWGTDAIMSRLQEEQKLSDIRPIPMDAVREFLALEYEEQRGRIFEYLFASREQALEWTRPMFRGA